MPLDTKSVIQSIITRLAVEMRVTGRKSFPLVHAALRVVKTLTQAHIAHIAASENVSDVTQFQYRGAIDRTMASRMPVVTPNPISTGRASQASLSTQQFGLTALCDPLQELLNRHEALIPELRVKALQAFAWLGFNMASLTRVQDVLVRQMQADTLPAEAFNGSFIRSFVASFLGLGNSSSHAPAHVCSTEVFLEFHERVKVTPNIVPFVLQLIYSWRVHLPHKFVPETAGHIWETILGYGPEARQQVLENIFQILDLLHKPGERLHSYRVQQHLFWFLGQHGVVLAGGATDGPSADGAINPCLCAILVRLEQAVVFHTWETRATCLDAIGKIAIMSPRPVRHHVVSFLHTLESDTCLARSVSSLSNLLTRIDTMCNDWTPIVKSVRLHHVLEPCSGC